MRSIVISYPNCAFNLRPDLVSVKPVTCHRFQITLIIIIIAAQYGFGYGILFLVRSKVIPEFRRTSV